MGTIKYYEPIIKPVADNGSLKLGVKLHTQSWMENESFTKMSIEIGGKTTEEAFEKLKNFLGAAAVELPCSYFYCSKPVIDNFKPFQVSKPFKSGYQFDKNDEFFVAWLNFDEVKKYYENIIDTSEENLTFFAWECIPGYIDVSRVNLKAAKREGLCLEIERKTGLTTEKNVAMTIYNLSEREGINPLELINKISK
jgi:hypothetical protein